MNLLTVGSFALGVAGLIMENAKERQAKAEQEAYIDKRINEGLDKRMAEMNKTEEDV